MKKPTEKQIGMEIAKLRAMKPSVRRYTTFGDDNWAKIDAQIQALEEGMTDEDTYDEWPDNSQGDVRYNAQDAIFWANGKEKEAPSKGWKRLTKNI